MEAFDNLPPEETNATNPRRNGNTPNSITSGMEDEPTLKSEECKFSHTLVALTIPEETPTSETGVVGHDVENTTQK